MVNFFHNRGRNFFTDRKMGKLDKLEAIVARPGAAASSLPEPAGRRPREAHLARIIACAERAFAEAGFGGTTMRQISAAAGLPKANLHYYFGTKERLYRAVLENILALWLDDMNPIQPEADPAEALAAYIRAKMAHSAARPHASKVFAAEILHGAPQLGPYLGLELRRQVAEKALVIEGWIARGRMAPVDPRHLFFTIWAMTQTYADFDVQIAAVLGQGVVDAATFTAGTETVLGLVLRGLGLDIRHHDEQGGRKT